ncbi:hypothetical protein J6590_057586 [Homalodisca vitripennis]|nr:hypothetical protein J6590_057586 [Homalodisca vitripennis]
MNSETVESSVNSKPLGVTGAINLRVAVYLEACCTAHAIQSAVVGKIPNVNSWQRNSETVESSVNSKPLGVTGASNVRVAVYLVACCTTHAILSAVVVACCTTHAIQSAVVGKIPNVNSWQRNSETVVSSFNSKPLGVTGAFNLRVAVYLVACCTAHAIQSAVVGKIPNVNR